MSSPYVFVSQLPSDKDTSSLLVELREHFASSSNTPQLIWLVVAESSGSGRTSDRWLELSRQIRERWPDCSVVLTISTPEELSILQPTPTGDSTGTLTIWAMAFPNTFVDAFHLTRGDSSDGSVLNGWPSSSPSAWEECKWLLLIGNDSSNPETSWVEKLRDELPSSTPILNFGMPCRAEELTSDD